MNKQEFLNKIQNYQIPSNLMDLTLELQELEQVAIALLDSQVLPSAEAEIKHGWDLLKIKVFDQIIEV